jgi:hypothetical protein
MTAEPGFTLLAVAADAALLVLTFHAVRAVVRFERPSARRPEDT